MDEMKRLEIASVYLANQLRYKQGSLIQKCNVSSQAFALILVVAYRRLRLHGLLTSSMSLFSLRVIEQPGDFKDEQQEVLKRFTECSLTLSLDPSFPPWCSVAPLDTTLIHTLTENGNGSLFWCIHIYNTRSKKEKEKEESSSGIIKQSHSQTTIGKPGN